jgi:hypothetical protein
MNRRNIWKLAQAMVDVIDANDAGDKPVMIDTLEGGYVRIKRTPVFNKAFVELKNYLELIKIGYYANNKAKVAK